MGVVVLLVLLLVVGVLRLVRPVERGQPWRRSIGGRWRITRHGRHPCRLILKLQYRETVMREGMAQSTSRIHLCGGGGGCEVEGDVYAGSRGWRPTKTMVVGRW